MVSATISDINQSSREKWAYELLGSLLDEPCVIQSGLDGVFNDIAQSSYSTTFTDDSGYEEDGIGLMVLQDPWNRRPDTQKVITSFLDTMYDNCQGNWIIRAHVRDFSRVVGLEDRYE